MIALLKIAAFGLCLLGFFLLCNWLANRRR